MKHPLFIHKALGLLIFASLLANPALAQDIPDWQPILDRFFTAEQQRTAATAQAADYMNLKERQVIAYTNLARLYPQQFDSFYLYWLANVDEDEAQDKFDAGDYFYTTLHRDLQQMKPLSPLQPNKKCFRAAEQWATYSGKNGLVGHRRPWWMRTPQAECCDYNPADDPMTMVLDLLIDEKVKSLGHRKILLGKWLPVGASIRPHTGYGWCLVMDFGDEK